MSYQITHHTPRSQPECNVWAPVGGFGNHVRWLLLLDDRFDFSIYPDQSSYKVFQGPDWPTYEDFCQLNWKGISLDILLEMRDRFASRDLEKPHQLRSQAQRRDFILECVYPSNRSWHNWLIFEWYYRGVLNSLVDLKHAYEGIEMVDTPVVLCNCDPEMAYRSYFKFNTSLNNLSATEFLNSTENSNQLHLKYQSLPHVMIVNTDELFVETLPKTWYQDLVGWLGFDDCYDVASEIHAAWYRQHCVAQTEFVQFVQEFYQTWPNR